MSSHDAPLTQSSLSRRTLIGASLGVLATTAPAPIGAGAQDATPGTTTGPWTFTDDKGVTVTLPVRPERIVADVNAAAPLWDFGIRPVAVFGWNASETGDFGPAAGNVDPAALEVVGNINEPIQLEPTIAVQPDLIVTITWAPDEPTEYWSIDVPLVPQVQAIAPIVAISATGSADLNTTRFAELAAALGADLNSTELVDAKTRYDAALADFPKTAAANPGLTVLFLSVGASADGFVVANPPDWADLSLYQSLGLTLIKPDTDPGTFWESLSMEQAIKYPADIIFNSTRPGRLTADELKAHPVFGQHPAVSAGQIGGWNQDFIMS